MNARRNSQQQQFSPLKQSHKTVSLSLSSVSIFIQTQYNIYIDQRTT